LSIIYLEHYEVIDDIVNFTHEVDIPSRNEHPRIEDLLVPLMMKVTLHHSDFASKSTHENSDKTKDKK
jgi:hypothetical protein